MYENMHPHQGTTQCSFAALHTPCSPTQPSLLQPLAAPDFTFSPWCCLFQNVPYPESYDMHLSRPALSLSNMHFGFIQHSVVSSSCLATLEMHITQFLFSFTYLKVYWLFQILVIMNRADRNICVFLCRQMCFKCNAMSVAV